MSPKVCLILTVCCLLLSETFGFGIHQRFRREAKPEESHDDEHDHDHDDDQGGIKFGSEQKSQSSAENIGGEGKGKAKGIQQHHMGQQQLAAQVGGKHYVLQQQTALGQQLAKLGKKTAIQQLAEAQQQAISNGKVKGSKKTDTKDKMKDDDHQDDDH